MTKKKKVKFRTTFTLVSPKVKVKPIPDKNVYGYAYLDSSQIEIDPRQDSKEFLDTLIHECVHLYLPSLKEKYVIKMATKIANLIWAKNYRRLLR